MVAALACAAIGCGDPEDDPGPAIDASAALDAGQPDAWGGSDAGPAPIELACRDGWVTQALPAPTVETVAPLLAAPPVPSALALHRRVLQASLAPEIGAAEPTARLVLVHLGDGADEAIRRAGLVPVHRVGAGFHVARLAAGADPGALLALDGVGTLLSLRTVDRIDPSLLGGDPAHVHDLTVVRVHDSGSLHAGPARGALAEAMQIADARDVLWVGLWSPPVPTLDLSRGAVRSEEVQGFSHASGLPEYTGTTGRGVRVALGDTGVDGEHPDFRYFDPSGRDRGTRVIGGGPWDGESHGTMVAGIMAGNGWASDGVTVRDRVGTPFMFRGHAPRVETIASFYMQDRTREPWLRAFVDLDAHLSNHSHTLSAGTYTWDAHLWDAAIRDGASEGDIARPPRPAVFAAANNGVWGGRGFDLRGYYSVLTPLKNAICVGGTYSNDDQYATSSSMGPTVDGRLKPDLVAPGFVDWRPPEGSLLEIDEVTLHADPASGQPDLVWNFDDPAEPGWQLRGELEDAEISGSIMRKQVLATYGAIELRPTDPIDTSAYESLSVRMRLVLGGTPGRHRWPWFWRASWSRRADRRFDGWIYPRFDPATQDDRWHTHRVPLTSSRWVDGVTLFRLSPVVYDDRFVAPVPGDRYGASGGTSFSAPVVSGVLALLLERLREDHGVDLETAPPLPSTLKALLLHTARDLWRDAAPARDRANPDTGEGVVYHRGPDFATGWGLLDATRALEVLALGRSEARPWTEHAIEEGEVHRYAFRVDHAAGTGPLEVTLAWDDAPAGVMLADSAPHLVNDLDAVLVAPDGRAHSPWVLDPLPFDEATWAEGIDPISPSDVVPARRCVEPSHWTGAGSERCEDHLNNVERVLVDEPEAGSWTLLVRGHSVPEGPQRYSLVITQRCAPPTP